MRKIKLNTYELNTKELYSLIPNYFYKYTKFNSKTKENLKKGRLFYNSPIEFNDPFDCKAHLNYGDTEMACLRNFEKFNSSMNIELSEDAKSVWSLALKNPKNFNLLRTSSTTSYIEKYFKITCFSNKFNNNLMWSHYADKHKGIVLKFKKDLNGTLAPILLPVQYFRKYPIIDIEGIPKEQLISVLYKVICSKGINWKYEMEWRAVTKKNSKLQYYNKNELVGIFFGLKTSEETKKEIYELINNSGYINIDFREAEFDTLKFKVKYKKYIYNLS